MVFVNNVKYACASCIKGHRSSSCSHTDRPLFEIKKKGRPVTQCEKCRELRKTRQVHVKCTCNDGENVDADVGGEASPSSSQAVAPAPASPPRKGIRKIPSTATLPNGLRDLLDAAAARSTSDAPANPKQKVDALLNPCHCKDAYRCKCRPKASESGSSSAPTTNVASTSSSSQTIVTSLPSESPKFPLRPRVRDDCPLGRSMYSKPANARSQRRHSNKPYARPVPLLLGKSNNSNRNASTPELERGPELPPLAREQSVIPQSIEIPEMLRSWAAGCVQGTDVCGCGASCACPGCKEHRGEAASGQDCPDGCGTCTDNTNGFALPLPDSQGDIDHFLRMAAAALPPPPSSRMQAVGVNINPMNVLVYPAAVLANQKAAAVAGLVKLPPLECCGGRCKCPADMCGCGDGCGGTCASHSDEQTPVSSQDAGKSCCAGKTTDSVVDVASSASTATHPISVPQKSCCASKASSEVAVDAMIVDTPPPPVFLLSAPDRLTSPAHESPRSCCAGKAITPPPDSPTPSVSTPATIQRTSISPVPTALA